DMESQMIHPIQELSGQTLRDYWWTVRTWTASSTFDFDYNAVTDRNDLQTILENIPKDCRN
ncbi:hypothetical protein, partial [Aestuariivirga sp.]|uniref:hypothetical protein n=1 Tax=Aestuariivirga sp. TaxID=2650926 RepID=UPI0030197DC1